MMNVKTKLPIRCDCRKTVKFTEVAQIREFCEYYNAHKKFTALTIVL